MTNFVPLHLHTNFSKDGLGTVEAMMEYAASLGYKALAVTDHGTMAAAVQFWGAAKAVGIKPIFGNEVYLEWGGKRGHLTVLSSGEVGFNNLLALNNAAHLNQQRGYPVTTVDMLAQFNQGLIVLTGCSASPLYYGTDADAMVFAGTLFDIFGKERMFAEVMGVIAEDNFTRPSMVAKRLGIRRVVTTDTHFTRKEYGNAHKILTSCRSGYDYDGSGLFLPSPDELEHNAFLKNYSDIALIRELMNTSHEVAESIDAYDLSSPPVLPHATSEYDLRKIAEVEFMGLTNVGQMEYNRLERELEVVEKLDLFDYFAILYDIVQFCKREGIKVGPGRGSGGGSYFLWLLGIIEVDPIQHGLLFERFLSLSRGDMADFDLDIESARRDEVIAYAKERWGAYPIANFSTYGHSSLIRDLGRYFRVPMEVVERAADSEDDEVMDEFFAYCRPGSGNADWQTTEKDARMAYDAMLGQVRHRGKHAGGIVIATRPLPIEGENSVVAWTEGIVGRQLSQAGVVKYDILGLRALSIMAELNTLTGVEPNEPWDNDNGPVFDLFCAGDTAGVFQFSGSAGIVELTKRVQPRTLSDLSAINGIYRPGPLDSGMGQTYPEAKHSGNVRNLHPDFDNILAETYGIIVYQEQVMGITAKVTGGNLEDADAIRKVISKGKVNDPKWQAKMREVEAHFKTEGYKRYSTSVIDTLWSEIVTFGRYGFNKSHSVAYSLLAYRMAWYKVYYPGAFFTALLNNDEEKTETWVYDAALHDVEVVPPHINYSGVKWVWNKDDGAIYAPLTAINHLGAKGAVGVVAYREKNGLFKRIEDVGKMPKSIFNKRAKKLMFLANGFRGMQGDVETLIEDYVELPVMSAIDMQRESLGFILPTKQIIDFLRGERAKGKVAGFVAEVEMRDKGKGAYMVVRLTPQGSFWTKDKSLFGKIEPGMLITAETTNGGNAKKVQRKTL